MRKMTEPQLNALSRLAGVSANGQVLQARGHLRAACAALVKRGYAKHLGDDLWTGAFFEITEAGRLALRS